MKRRKERTYEVEFRESNGVGASTVMLVDAPNIYRASEVASRAQRRGRRGPLRDMYRPRVVQIRDLLLDRL